MDSNYANIIDALAKVVPSERPALIFGDQVVTWGEFDRRTNNLASSFLNLGLGFGDRIGILCRNLPAYMEFMVSGLKCRLLTVNINYRYTPDEIAYVLNDCSASAFFYQEDFEPLIQDLRARCGTVRFWIRIESDRQPGPSVAGAISFEELAETGDGAPLAIERSAGDGFLLYTGGTTGFPKGVQWASSKARLSHFESPLVTTVPKSLAEHVENVRLIASPGRVIPACPLMHGTGVNATWGELLNGGSAVILPSARFSADEVWREVERTSATRISIVGDVFAKPLLAALDANPGGYRLSSLKSISSSGVIWSHQVKARLLEHLPHVTLVDVMGASEAPNFGFAIGTKDNIQTTGLFDAGPNTVLIDPETGKILPKDQPAEGLIARSGSVPVGYYGDEAKTAETFRVIDGERYAVPGDFARWAPPNQFMLIGRGNLSINTGGEKVFPEEVEEALKLLPGVVDALVLGKADEKWGKIVVAVVSTTDDFEEAAVRAGLSKTLSSFKHPKIFVHVNAVPRHESGKADYRAAAALLPN